MLALQLGSEKVAGLSKFWSAPRAWSSAMGRASRSRRRLVALPGGGMARICTKRDTYPDGREWVGKGIRPTVKAAPAVADLRKGRDTVLEAALRR
jgi:C-terminal processing protease CtpA/Prc